MSKIDSERRVLKGSALAAVTLNLAQPDPLAVRIPEATRISGFSRSEIYRRAGRGEIVLLKCGKSTLVDVPSLRTAVNSLPRAIIRPTTSGV
jgi:hypothetical protein